MKILLLFLSLSMCHLMSHAEYRNIKKGDIVEINGNKALVFQIDETGNHGKAMYVKAFRGEATPWCTKSHLVMIKK